MSFLNFQKRKNESHTPDSLLNSRIPKNVEKQNAPKIYFSEEAYNDIWLETKEKISTETGGIWLGKVLGNNWVVLETIDPGPHSIFSPAYFEYDQEYVEHLANKVARRYDSLELLGLWHRHPGNFNDFSKTDFETFEKYTQYVDRGIISGLVNLVPEFEFTLYFIAADNKHYYTIDYEIESFESLRKKFGITKKRMYQAENKCEFSKDNTRIFSTELKPIYAENSILNNPESREDFSEDNEIIKLQSLMNNKKDPTVFLPVEYLDNAYCGDLYGFYNLETNIYNVVDENLGLETQFLGLISKNKAEKVFFPLQGFYENESLVLYNDMNEKCTLESYSLINDIFSRNVGIIESDRLLNKQVLISGCGSVGSYIAVELAKAGVGNFVLVDNDTLSYGNICRHQCGISDVGKYKVTAVANKIKDINPKARIKVFNTFLENVLKDDFVKINKINKFDLIVGAADSRQSDLYANRISNLLDIPFVSIGFWERAFAGEIFYSIPGETACYNCVWGKNNIDDSNRGDNLDLDSHENEGQKTKYDSLNSEKNESETGEAEEIYKANEIKDSQLGALDHRVSENKHIYSFETDLNKINYEPGISLDINYVTNIGLKVILDLLNRDYENYRPKVLNYLTNMTLVCNYIDGKTGGQLGNIFTYPLQITNSINTNKLSNCPHCNLRGKFYEETQD